MPARGRPDPDRAGGIRTHGLELMRLARTATPLPRRSGRQESNLRSPAPEAGGVATLPYDQTNEKHPRRNSNPQLPGREPGVISRSTTGAGRLRRQGSNLRLTINSRASFHLDHTGTRNSGRGGSRTPRTRRPTRFRDGVPRPWQPFQQMAPAGLEPASHRLRVGGSPD